MTASPLTFPDVSKIMSRNEHGPAGEDEWRVITPTQARHIFDDGGRVARLEGDTVRFLYPLLFAFQLSLSRVLVGSTRLDPYANFRCSSSTAHRRPS